jgi:GNAT superfamily N-acetyltransferase
MIIREATLADAAAITKVHFDSWQTTYPGIIPGEYLARQTYERRLNMHVKMLSSSSGEQFRYIAEEESGGIVGIASGGSERSGDPVYLGELYGIYLLQSHQRQGIGRRLTLAIADRLAEHCIRSMLVWVLAANPSRGFYEAHGGQVVRAKEVEMGGAMLEEVACGWKETNILRGG